MRIENRESQEKFRSLGIYSQSLTPNQESQYRESQMSVEQSYEY